MRSENHIASLFLAGGFHGEPFCGEPLGRGQRISRGNFDAICEYLQRHERNKEANAFFNRVAQEEEAQRKIAFERGNLSPNDPLISHGLDTERIEKISSKVQTLDWVLAAFLCRKPAPLSPDQPLYLLALKPRRGFLIPAFRPGMTAFDQVAALNCFPTETRFLLLDGSQPTLEKNIRKLPNSLLFKRCAVQGQREDSGACVANLA